MISLDYGYFGRGSRAVLKLNPVAKLFQNVFAWMSRNPRQITFLDVKSWVRELVRKLAIVCEEKQAFCVKVEATNGINSNRKFGDKLQNCRAISVIADSRQIPRRFIEKDIEFPAFPKVRPLRRVLRNSNLES